MPRKSLTLGERVKVIEEYNEGKCSIKQLIQKYDVGRSQMYSILHNQNKILDDYAKGRSARLKRFRRNTANEEINQAVYNWYLKERDRGTSVKGPMLQNEALLLAKMLGKNDFKASNGWLDSFKRRYDIQSKIQASNHETSEAGTVIIEKKWKDNIKELIIGYHSSNIYVGDAIGLLYRLLPNQFKCHNQGELSNEQLTILLCVNMNGNIETPLVIGNDRYPSCFKNLNQDTLPVHWRYNKKSRVNNNVLTQWLHHFNVKLRSENRNVILFLNGTVCATKLTLSNIQLELFPSDGAYFMVQAISGLANIIKSHYRKFFLQTLIARSNVNLNFAELQKKINVLDAINWVSQSIKKIHPELVKNCFRTVGLAGSEPSKMYNQSIENLNEILELCILAGLSDSDEDIISFDDHLELVEDALETVVKEEDPIKEELDEGNGEDESKVQIGSYYEALRAVDGLQEFAAMENHAKLMQLLLEIKELIVPTIVKQRAA